MKILGISCFYHDSAAALIVDDQIIAAAQEERFSRIKGDESFPAQSIAYCLQQGHLALGEIDAIVFYEKPFLKFERILETYLNVAPRGLKSFLTAMPPWLQKKLNQKKLLRNEFMAAFNFKPNKIYFSQHHLSHAASAFFPSPFEKSAVLCVDGVGEWATTSAWSGDKNQLTPLWEVKFPHSLGLLYSTFTHYCGFKINSGEYKLMGLAPFGQPSYVDIIKSKLIHLSTDGSFWLDTKYFGFIDGLNATNEKFELLFGHPARKSEEPLTEFYKDIAASIQAVLNEAMLNLVKRLKQDSNSENLCLAGGVALNCVTNGLIAQSKIFKNIWIQPAAGDAGGALGCALAFKYASGNTKRIVSPEDSMKNAELGPRYPLEDIKSAILNYDLVYEVLNDVSLIDETARLLSQNKVIGWFQGRMEFGPRALGNRSILASPLGADMKKMINLKIKFREGFRPFAPIVTEEAYPRYFSLPNKNEYMLLVSDVIDPKLMPAITHVDASARVQIASKKKKPKLHLLLEMFEKISGHPVLINTSFNIRGEPIVNTPTDAINCFINTDLDVLVLENFMIRKLNNKHLKRDENWQGKFDLD